MWKCDAFRFDAILLVAKDVERNGFLAESPNLRNAERRINSQSFQHRARNFNFNRQVRRRVAAEIDAPFLPRIRGALAIQ